MIFSAGCKTPKVVVIPADKEVRFLRAGEPFTGPIDYYLVPPARMQEILHQLSDKISAHETAR